MDQSHLDLRDRFAVTGPELDDMVTCARQLPGCLGSRMTGAGFGGCTVSLVENAHVDDFVSNLTNNYRAKHELPVAVYVTRRRRSRANSFVTFICGLSGWLYLVILVGHEDRYLNRR